MTILDSSGIEAWVTENNPKYANRIINQLKAYAKAHHFDNNYEPYKVAYGSMPSQAVTNQKIKHLYIDGHFCYASKIGIVKHGLGIIRHLNFFHAHPLINLKTFLGDSAFDSAKLYKDLLSGDTFGTGSSEDGIHFSKAFIPLNSRAGLENKDYSVNENGIRYCPNDPDLHMKLERSSNLKSGVTRYKFSYPKEKWIKNPKTGKYQFQCQCSSPCTDSPYGRMVYLYQEKDIRTFPIHYGTAKWDTTYKIRTSVERSISHLKDSFDLQSIKPKTKKHFVLS